MKKNFSLLFLLIISISLLGCSKTTTDPINKTIKVTPPPVVEPIKPVELAEPVGTASIPAFDKTAVMKASGKSVPVLMYHSIAYEKDNDIRLPVERFEEHMKYLKDNGYYPITLTDLYEYLMKDTPIPEKSIVLTFDDGYEDNYTAMFPVLKKYGFKATIFVITSNIDKDPKSMTSQQLLEMEKFGVDIESHTVNHEHLKELSKDKQLETLGQSKKDLEKILNKQINFLAYPYGEYNKSALEAAKEVGYTMAFSTDGRWSSKKNGMLSLDRVYIGSSHNMKVFIERITNPNYKFVN
ncbi:MAG: polysaccharide deacetylase family protein [Clostridiaceae bacterium]|nr:polysaccharide deacetylase family protein [Clostridiaceae bacterium]